jgi:hypothetical protein
VTIEIGDHCHIPVRLDPVLGPVACARPAPTWTTVNGEVRPLCHQHARECPWCHTASLTARVESPAQGNLHAFITYECTSCVRIFNVWEA